MHDRPFLVVRELDAHGRPHAYDVVLDWIAENFPDHLPLFRVASLPLSLGETDYSLHVPWLKDPVQAHSMELYDQAMKLAAECDRRGIPIINRVDRLINATKLLGASLIAEAGVRVPKMARVTSAEEFRDTLCGIPLPLILREDWGHQGELLRADTVEEARALPLDRFARPIAVELIDIRDPRDGYLRKYRYFAIGDAGVASHLQISRDWITRGKVRISGEDSRREELDYIGRPDPNHRALQHARRSLGLDYVAFDYGYDREGRVVVWEANPYPYLHFSARSLTYRNASMHRTIAGLLKLCLDRAGIPSPERLDALLDPSRTPSSTWSGRAPAPVSLTERATARPMRCLGEFTVSIAPGDSLSLAPAPADPSSMLILVRGDDGRAVPVPLRRGSLDGLASATLELDAAGPLLLTVLADEATAASIGDTLALVHRTARAQPTRLGAAARGKSRLHGAPALVLGPGRRAGHFRVRTVLDGPTRFCLAAVSLERKGIEGGVFSSFLRSSYRYVDIAAGATLVPNPFAGVEALAVFLVPWSPGDRTADLAAVHGFEALQVAEVAGAPAGATGAPPQVQGAAPAADGHPVFAELDKAHEARVAALLDMARRTASGEVRQAAVDRLVAMNRWPDGLIARPGVSARAASSFRRALATWSRKAELQQSTPGLGTAVEWQMADPDQGDRLASLLGATPLPRHGPYPPSEALRRVAETKRPVVLKPAGAAGSPGAFVVHGRDAILDLRRRHWIADLDALAGEVAALSRESWRIEDFVAKPGDPLSPASGLRFFSFYGRVGLVVEVEHYPVARRAIRLGDGRLHPAGRDIDRLFEGEGFTAAELATVAEIGARLPLPFMRIDLLRGGTGLLFDAFTPMPDDVEELDPELDALLGDLFLDAELRLMRDLLAGKRFPAFTDWASAFRPRQPDRP